MTNKTISALSSASTIVGTEVLPIVQSSATVKVSVANLTSGLGTIIATKGGTGQTSYSVGDIIYADTTTTLAKLGIGAANYVLTSSGTVPQYVAQSTLSVGTATNATNVGNNRQHFQFMLLIILHWLVQQVAIIQLQLQALN